MEDKIDTILSLAEELTLSQLFYLTGMLQQLCETVKDFKWGVQE